MKPRVRMLTLLILSTCLLLFGQMPRTSTVEPAIAKPGAELTITGESLDAKVVKEVFLTDGQNDTKLAISSQTATLIKCRIPASMKTGRFGIMLLTAGADPKLIEQPLRVTIE